MLVGISGKRGTGKDLLGAILQNKYGFQRLSFAGDVKHVCQALLRLTPEQTDGDMKEQPTEYVKTYVSKDNTWVPGTYYTPREIMIMVGQFYKRFDPLFWIRPVLKEAEEHDRAVITDVRFKNEYSAIKEQGGCLVRLERAAILNPYGAPLLDSSETELDNMGFDLCLPADKNRDMGDLEAFADTIIAHLKLEQAQGA